MTPTYVDSCLVVVAVPRRWRYGAAETVASCFRRSTALGSVTGSGLS